MRMTLLVIVTFVNASHEFQCPKPDIGHAVEDAEAGTGCRSTWNTWSPMLATLLPMVTLVRVEQE